MKQNYQKQLEELIRNQGESVPGTAAAQLLRAVQQLCAGVPFSAFLHYGFIIIPIFIRKKEYRKRAAEQRTFIKRLSVRNPVGFLEGEFKPEEFYKAAAGMEELLGGGTLLPLLPAAASQDCTDCQGVRI